MRESNNSKKTGYRFEPGNKHGRGRPQGSRNRATIALQALLDGEGAALTRKAISMALNGDTVALRLCMERLLPPTKDRAISVSLPAVRSTADVMSALGELLKAVSAGEITPSEAQSVAALLEAHRRAAETLGPEERISALEKSIEDRK